MTTWTLNGRTWGDRQADVPGTPYYMAGTQVFRVWHLLMQDIGAECTSARAAGEMARQVAATLPAMAGAISYLPRVRADGAAYELRSPAQVLTDIGAAAMSRQIMAGTGLTGGGTLGADRTIALANTAVTAGSYGNATQVATYTVDAQGRLTAAANVTLTPAWASITGRPTTVSGYGITDAWLTGEIKIYGGAVAPTGWLLCDGAAVSRTTYAGLFAVLGTAYGTGNGSTTFNLPDMRGRVPVGAGSGPGLTARARGDAGGHEETDSSALKVVVSDVDPDDFLGGSNIGSSISPIEGENWVGGLGLANDGGAGIVLAGHLYCAPGSGDSYMPVTGGLGEAGNMQPFAVVSYIIKT